MCHCLVTGGAGFIGSHLVERLIECGHTVRVLDDFSTGQPQNLSGARTAVEILHGSVLDTDRVEAAVQGIRWLFHLAALPSVQRSLEAPLATHAVCATGTLNVLQAARQAGVQRVIYAASSSVYGNPGGRVRREQDAADPQSPYAAAKLAGEHYCQAYTAAYGLETVRLRFFNIFGPRQRSDSPYAGVIARFIAAVAAGAGPTVHGDGRQSRDFTYVANAASALLLAAATPGISGSVYNVGTGGSTSLCELLGLLNQLLGKDVKSRHGPARPGDVRHSQADISRARRELGYHPEIPFLEGLRRTVLDHQATWPHAQTTE